jgi:hypothetical protein
MPYISGQPSHWAKDMTDSVIVYSASTLDNYGKQTIAGTGTTYAARVVSTIGKTRDEQGQQIVEGGKLYILGDATINVGDRLDLPAYTADPRITGVRKVIYSANGTSTIHHTEVTFGAV